MLVSIIIPSFNDGIYLSDAIESVRRQTYIQSLIEVIVVDDGSTDDTAAIAVRLGVKVIRQEKRGLPAARNAGIVASSGDLILPLDADDKIHPDYLLKATKIFSDYSDIGIVHVHRKHFGQLETIKLAERFSIEALKNRCIINYCSMYRKQVWLDCSGYDENMVLGFEDWDFWFRVYKSGWQFFLLEEVLFFYRKHENRLSHIAQRNVNLLMDDLKQKHQEVFF